MGDGNLNSVDNRRLRILHMFQASRPDQTVWVRIKNCMTYETLLEHSSLLDRYKAHNETQNGGVSIRVRRPRVH